jgi:hypothetical protein
MKEDWKTITDIEEVDIEDYTKRGEPVPPAKRYVIRVDKDRFTVSTPTIKGAAVLALAGKTPDKFKLYQLTRGHQPTLVAPDDTVDLRAPGVERFTTMPTDTTEGEHHALVLHKTFHLPEGDENYLDSLGLPWETVRDRQTMWLLIHDWKLPNGYNVPSVSLALLIPPGYADSQLDMIYFRPALSRTDARTIGALSSQQICGETWQRWSRHRTAQNPWRAGIDEVASHLSLVDEWLRRELSGEC